MPHVAPRPGRALLAAVVIAAGTAGPFAVAAPAVAHPCPVVAYTADADASLAHLGLLNLRPLGLPLPSLADVTLAPTSTSVDSTASRAGRAVAHYATASVLGVSLTPDWLGLTASRSAPSADDETPDRSSVAEARVPTLAAGVGTLRAEAHWRTGDRCPTAPRSLTEASTSVLDATVLPGNQRTVEKAGGNADATGVLRLRDALSTTTGTGLVATDPTHLGVRARSTARLVDLSLFTGTPQQITIGVLDTPTLAVTAAGAGRSTVAWSAPTVEVWLPGHTERLDTPGKALDVGVRPTGHADATTLTGDPLGAVAKHAPARTTSSSHSGGDGHLLQVRISLGGLQQHVTDTSVTASASVLRLQVTAAGANLLDVSLGALSASASAPAKGIATGTSAAPSPTASGPGRASVARVADGPSLPVTGYHVSRYAGAGAALLAGGAVLFGAAARTRRRRLPGRHRPRR